MEDQKIIRLSLLTIIIGVFILILLSTKINFEREYSIIHLENGANYDENIVVNGRIVNARVSNNVTIITIKVQEEVDIVTFEELYFEGVRIDDIKLNKARDNNVKVSGRLQINEYGKSIIADVVELIE